MTGQFLKKGETVFAVSAAPIEATEGCTVETVCAEQGLYALHQSGDTLEYRVRTGK